MSDFNFEKSSEKTNKSSEKALTVAEIKSQWGFKKADDGSIRITSYKGDALEVCVPEMVGKNPVTEIGDEAFSISQDRCKNMDVRRSITSIFIPEGVKRIGIYVFCLCESLKTVSLPSTLTHIETYAFQSAPGDITIIGVKGSLAEEYALRHGIHFEERQ